MNLASWIVLGAITAWAVAALIYALRHRGSCGGCGGSCGGAGCCGDCAHCKRHPGGKGSSSIPATNTKGVQRP